MPTNTRKTFAQGHYTATGKDSKTHDPACSEAMSAWKKSGVLTSEAAKILAGCRKKAAALRGEPGTGPPGKAIARVKEARARTAVAATAPAAVDKAKYTSKKAVGKDERAAADQIEHRVARWVGGKVVKGCKPGDVRVSRGGKDHKVEVKSRLFGEKQTLTVHDDAFYRKVVEANSSPNIEFHTIVVDIRNKYDSGKHKENYSGHGIYYKRGSGAFALSKMYKVKHPSELKALMAMDDLELPPEARGSLRMSHKEMAVLAEKARKAAESRERRQAAYDEDLRSRGLTRHNKTIRAEA